MADAPGGTSGTRLLRRSRTDRLIAGVAGGVARYLGVDSVLIRIAFVALAIAGGSGLLIYVVGWILIPEEKEGEQLGDAPPPNADTARLVFGAALIGIGIVLLLGLSIPRIGKYLWPLALIAIGVAVIVQASRR
jgi:phage shock protein C